MLSRLALAVGCMAWRPSGDPLECSSPHAVGLGLPPRPAEEEEPSLLLDLVRSGDIIIEFLVPLIAVPVRPWMAETASLTSSLYLWIPHFPWEPIKPPGTGFVTVLLINRDCLDDNASALARSSPPSLTPNLLSTQWWPFV